MQNMDFQNNASLCLASADQGHNVMFPIYLNCKISVV